MTDAPASTRPCPDCASPVRATDQSFCDSCGAFLRWNGRQAEDPAGASAEDPAEAPTEERAEERAADEAPAPASPEDTVVRSLLVPVPEHEEDEPPAVAAPVLPARPEAPPPTVRTPEAPAAAPDGPPCPACARPNVPGRRFCRFCATPMVPERPDTADGPYAGQRPGLPRDRRHWIARALVAAGVVTVVVGGVIGGPPAARAVQDHFATRVAVHPVSWAASHSAPKQAPLLAGDGYSNTWWGTGYAGDSAGQYLEARFGEPTDLLDVLITPGSSRTTAQSDGQAAPRTFDLVVIDSSGTAHVSHHTVNDGGAQRLAVRVRDAMSVRLVLRTAWRADARKQVAVAELEFFGRSVS
ncbi:NADase-type glycan-binding domain-containing protein [Streptomyces sp. NPDC004788]